VTLAPEMTTPSMIARLTAAGVVVSAGHTNATYEEIRTALKHGLTGFTHLFNAMSQLTGRAPGVVGRRSMTADSWCGIIVDGRHVDPAVLRIALRCKRHDRFMLVTRRDAERRRGREVITLQGRTISIADGVLVDEDGTLAGSDTEHGDERTQRRRAPRPAAGGSGADGEPLSAEFLGLGAELGRIAPGYRASLALMDGPVPGDRHLDRRPQPCRGRDRLKAPEIALTATLFNYSYYDTASRQQGPAAPVPIRSIAIIGGGTAGWMTALILADALGKRGVEISLLESPSVETIGVGEGSTPWLRGFFDRLRIEESEWMPACNATYKCASPSTTGRRSPASRATSIRSPRCSTT